MCACVGRCGLVSIGHTTVFIYFSIAVLFCFACRKSLLIAMIILSIDVKQNGMLLVYFTNPAYYLLCIYFFSVTGILGTNSSVKVLLLMYYPFLSLSDSSLKCLLSFAAMSSTPPPLMKKHSQTDLVSRLKSRKVLGVGGEDDDGEVHRSKVTYNLPVSLFIFDLNSSYSLKKAFFLYIFFFIF